MKAYRWWSDAKAAFRNFRRRTVSVRCRGFWSTWRTLHRLGRLEEAVHTYNNYEKRRWIGPRDAQKVQEYRSQAQAALDAMKARGNVAVWQHRDCARYHFQPTLRHSLWMHKADLQEVVVLDHRGRRRCRHHFGSRNRRRSQSQQQQRSDSFERCDVYAHLLTSSLERPHV